jgi:hypothetical protein
MVPECVLSDPMKKHAVLRKRRRTGKKLPRAPKAVVAPPPAAKPSFQRELLEKGKAIADQALDRLVVAIEKDPEAVIQGAERALGSLSRIAMATEELRKWARENPEEARRRLREAVLQGIAKATKKKTENEEI